MGRHRSAEPSRRRNRLWPSIEPLEAQIALVTAASPTTSDRRHSTISGSIRPMGTTPTRRGTRPGVAEPQAGVGPDPVAGPLDGDGLSHPPDGRRLFGQPAPRQRLDVGSVRDGGVPGPHRVGGRPLGRRLHGTLDAQQDSYLYLVGLDFVTDPGTAGGGDVLQIASDDHVLIRDCTLDGFDGTARQPQETLKANQCQYVYVEGSDISGAFWFPLDFVAVQYGHILGCKIHDAGDDGLVLKGGTAEILVQGNEVYDVATVGITAGQGTGLEFMVAPWVQYEAYDLQIVGNDIHDVQNAGLAVLGGTNIVATGNVLYNVGLNQDVGSAMLLIGLGSRSCDGDVAACQANQALGGWGPTQPGEGGEWIPDHDVTISGNVFVNPAGSATLYDTITIADPADPPPETNIPSPARADDGLSITGNTFWNGGPDHNLGVDDPVLAAQIRQDNQFATVEPPLTPPPLGVGNPPLPPITSAPPGPAPSRRAPRPNRRALCPNRRADRAFRQSPRSSGRGSTSPRGSPEATSADPADSTAPERSSAREASRVGRAAGESVGTAARQGLRPPSRTADARVRPWLVPVTENLRPGPPPACVLATASSR